MERNQDNDVNYEPYMFFRRGRPQQDREEVAEPKERPHRARTLVAVLMIAVLFCLSIFVADLYANEGILAVWKDKNEDASKTFFVYCVDSYHQNAQGLMSAGEVKNMGGAGYLFFDGKYYLAAAIYKTREDAEKVKKDTANSGGLIYELTVSDPKLEWCRGGNKSAVKRAVVAAYDLYNGLYDVSVRLDEGNLDMVDAIAKINVLAANLDKLTADFEETIKNENKFGYVKTKTYLLILSALLDNAKSEILAGANASGAVRYAYCAALFLASSTAKSL